MSTIAANTLTNNAGTGAPDFTGMPTVDGTPVVESGSNSDGEWTRWADGTQHVSWLEGSDVSPDISWSAWYRTPATAMDYPQPFVAIPRVAGITHQTSGGYSLGGAAQASPTGVQIFMAAPYEGSAARRGYTATGRYK